MNPIVKDFEDALTPAARRRLERDPNMTLLIEKCITDGWEPTILAEHVGHGIHNAQPSNARDLMIWRLCRAAGLPVE